MKTYNWMREDWPNFTYDTHEVEAELYQYAQEANSLAGGVSQLAEGMQYEAYIDLMVSEALESSAIEGEIILRDDVRSSIKNQLGLSDPKVRVTDARAEGIAALMISVRKDFSKPLTKEMICEWHRNVLHTSDDLLGNKYRIGEWRTDKMEIVSGPIGDYRVHYEAVPAEKIDEEMDRFIEWYNSKPGLNEKSMHGPVKAAIAHFWFSCIHPFDDGNGRLSRSLAEKALSQDLGSVPLMSISKAILNDKKSYYSELEQASGDTMDIGSWVNWFVHTTKRAQIDAKEQVQFVLDKARFWDKFKDIGFNERQEKAIGKMFEVGTDGFTGGMNNKKYANITKCSRATAARDLVDLQNKGCLRVLGGGRSTRYELQLGQESVFGLSVQDDTWSERAEKLKNEELSGMADMEVSKKGPGPK